MQQDALLVNKLQAKISLFIFLHFQIKPPRDEYLVTFKAKCVDGQMVSQFDTKSIMLMLSHGKQHL